MFGGGVKRTNASSRSPESGRPATLQVVATSNVGAAGDKPPFQGIPSLVAAVGSTCHTHVELCCVEAWRPNKLRFRRIGSYFDGLPRLQCINAH